MLHVPTFATTDAHERYCRGVIEPAGMVTHSETTVGLERRALEAIQRLGFREAEILAVNGQVQKAEAFRKMIRANMLHRDKDRMWGPVRARGPSELRHLDFGRFQRMTEPSTSSSGPYAAAGSQQARGSVHATTARVPADYSGAMDHTRAHYEKPLGMIFSYIDIVHTMQVQNGARTLTNRVTTTNAPVMFAHSAFFR